MLFKDHTNVSNLDFNRPSIESHNLQFQDKEKSYKSK